jgi:hypothetical protein
VVVVLLEEPDGEVVVVLLGDDDMLLELGDVELELLEPGVVLMLALPETDDPLGEVVVVVLPGDAVVSVVVVELEEGVVLLVVVLGVVTVVDDEELGVVPEGLLQPVAATLASAMAATMGIRRFMTSSPINVRVRVEEMLWCARQRWMQQPRDRRTTHASRCFEGDTPAGGEFDAEFLATAGKYFRASARNAQLT